LATSAAVASLFIGRNRRDAEQARALLTWELTAIANGAFPARASSEEQINQDFGATLETGPGGNSLSNAANCRSAHDKWVEMRS
jgi:hypothetical protein